MLTACGGATGLDAPDPDAPCCTGSSFGAACTCWEEIVEPEQSNDLQEGPSAVQPRMCSDCAYRPDSPEDGEPNAGPQSSEHVFWCHQPRIGAEAMNGMPLVVGYIHRYTEHGELGTGEVRLPNHGDSYRPESTYEHPRHTWNADGAPAVMCAGWALRAGVRPPRGNA